MEQLEKTQFHNDSHKGLTLPQTGAERKMWRLSPWDLWAVLLPGRGEHGSVGVTVPPWWLPAALVSLCCLIKQSWKCSWTAALRPSLFPPLTSHTCSTLRLIYEVQNSSNTEHVLLCRKTLKRGHWWVSLAQPEAGSGSVQSAEFSAELHECPSQNTVHWECCVGCTQSKGSSCLH